MTRPLRLAASAAFVADLLAEYAPPEALPWLRLDPPDRAPLPDRHR